MKTEMVKCVVNRATEISGTRRRFDKDKTFILL